MTEPVDFEMIDARLENWGRCVRDRKIVQCARSFEGRYRSPQCWEAPRGRLPTFMDDAWEIESAWRALGSLQDSAVLWGWYIPRWSREKTLREAVFASQGHRRGRLPDWDMALVRAQANVWELLGVPAVIRRERVAGKVLRLLAEHLPPFPASRAVA